jgi:hypothetical protein
MFCTQWVVWSSRVGYFGLCKNQKPTQGLPDEIEYYNSTKSPVDEVNKMEETYSYSIINFRWPMKILNWIVNIAVINAMIFFKNHLERRGLNANYDAFFRKNFLYEVAMQLMKEQIDHYSYFNNHVTKTFRKVFDLENGLNKSVKGHLPSGTQRCTEG